MYAKSKHSLKKPCSSKMKDNVNASTSSFKQKESKAESNQFVEDREIILPTLRMVDAEKFLQTYTAILRRPKEEGVGMEDLDKLQMELEMMLSNVVLRQRTIRSELEQISAAEEIKFKRTCLSVVKTKRHRKYDTDNGDTDNAEDTKDFLNGSKINDDADGSLEQFKEMSRELPKRHIPIVPPSVTPIGRNDISNKFWTMVEPYCADVTIDDIKFLEDLIKSYDLYEKDDYTKIPLLGTHYSLRWAQKDSNSESDVVTWTKSENDVSEGSDAKDIDAVTPKNDVPAPGPIVQRLVSALIEENVPSSSGASKRVGRVDKETDENFGQPIMKKSIQLSLNGLISTNEFSELDENYRKLPFFHTSQCFEKKVRKELEAIGFLDPTNETNQDDSDEVVTELKRCQEELNTVAVKNKKVLQHLLPIAKTEFKKKQIKNQLKIINSELADINMKNVSLKMKKKHLSKKEAEDAWNLLKEREALLIKLEEIS